MEDNRRRNETEIRDIKRFHLMIYNDSTLYIKSYLDISTKNF